jgi:hypothetical protein
MQSFIKTQPIIGPCEIDTNAVVKKWNHLWGLKEHNGVFRLYKYKRKDSMPLAFKIAISKEQAEELISQLGLAPFTPPFFWNVTFWSKDANKLKDL